MLLMAASFIPDKPEITNGVICFVCSLIGMVWEYFKDHDFDRIKRVVKNLDYDTILLLTALFMVISSTNVRVPSPIPFLS